MLTSLVSLFTQEKSKKICNDWRNYATWKSIAVGGIKEKILAAKRAKIKKVSVQPIGVILMTLNQII